MAQKKITELQLKSSVVGDESLPVDNGIQSYRVTPSQMYDYMRTRFIFGSSEISNLSFTTAVGSNALTIALKTKAAADASASDPIRIAFRSSTLTSGAFVARTITGALSVVVSSGSTLGQVSAQPSRIWIYLIDNAGTPELAVSHSLFSETDLVSTTAEGGAGAADSATVMYSTSARSSVACRLIGYIDNTQTTAGTWLSAGTQLQVLSFIKQPVTVQKFTSGSGTYLTPAGCTRIRVRMVGGGGGGSGGGLLASAQTAGTTGNNTTFGSLTAGGGAGGGIGGAGPTAGGTNTFSGTGFEIPGGDGGGQAFASLNTSRHHGGSGGSSFFAGGGGSGYNAAGSNGATNSGAGGGGGGEEGNGGSFLSGAGGGAGGYIEALISNPVASYAYGIGASAGGGNAGTTGSGGGQGAAGVIIVEEFYD